MSEIGKTLLHLRVYSVFSYVFHFEDSVFNLVGTTELCLCTRSLRVLSFMLVGVFYKSSVRLFT